MITEIVYNLKSNLPFSINEMFQKSLNLVNLNTFNKINVLNVVKDAFNSYRL